MAMSLGLSNGGTREISLRSNDGDKEPIELYRSLLTLTILLAIIGAIVFISLSDVIARYLNIKIDITYLFLGIASSIISGYFTAIFTGRRMIKQIALISMISGALSLIIGITTLLLQPNYAVAAIVISQPLSLLLVSVVYAPQNTLKYQKEFNFTKLFNTLRPIFRLSLAFLITSLITLCGHLLLRLIIMNQFGEIGLGQFQAAWTTSILYLGFVITAMGTFYFPLLTNC